MKSMNRLNLVTIGISFLVLWGIPAQAQVVYTANFDSNPVLNTGATVIGSGLAAGFTGPASIVGIGIYPAPYSGNFYQNTATGNPATETILTINNLPTHNHISINFLLAVIDSWDGNLGSPFGPDFFNVSVDNNLLFHETFISTTISNLTNQTHNGQPMFSDSNYFNNFYNDNSYDFGTVPSLNNIFHTRTSLKMRS